MDLRGCLCGNKKRLVYFIVGFTLYNFPVLDRIYPIFSFYIIFPAFCIAPAVIIVDLSKKAGNVKVEKLPPFVVISAIGFFGLASTTMLITQNDTSPYFKAEAFLTKYLLYNSNEKITVISNPFYLWIPQYVFHLDHDYYGFLGVREINTKNLILIVDDDFRNLISFDDDYESRLHKMYESYDKNVWLDLRTLKY